VFKRVVNGSGYFLKHILAWIWSSFTRLAPIVPLRLRLVYVLYWKKNKIHVGGSVPIWGSQMVLLSHISRASTFLQWDETDPCVQENNLDLGRVSGDTLCPEDNADVTQCWSNLKMWISRLFLPRPYVIFHVSQVVGFEIVEMYLLKHKGCLLSGSWKSFRAKL